MKELSKQELVAIVGGVNVTGSLINSFTNIIKAILDVGKNLGSAIRRIGENKTCALK